MLPSDRVLLREFFVLLEGAWEKEEKRVTMSQHSPQEVEERVPYIQAMALESVHPKWVRVVQKTSTNILSMMDRYSDDREFFVATILQGGRPL